MLSERYQPPRRPSAKEYLSVIESRAYDELMQAKEQSDTVMREVQTVYATTQDQKEAEAIIARTLLSKVHEAQREEHRALQDWMDSITEGHQATPK